MSLFEDNAEVLRNIAAKGRDLSKSYLVDFVQVFETLPPAQRFAEAAYEQGFEVEVTEDSDGNVWDVTASKRMVPTCETITATEGGLDALARTFGGHADGWGFLSSSADPL